MNSDKTAKFAIKNIMANLFGYLFLSFLLVVVGFQVWNVYDQWQFTNIQGDIRRGVVIWSEPITWEIRQFLEALSTTFRYRESFICKVDNEILISHEHSFYWNFRGNSLRYVAYLNLNDQQGHIQFRVSLSTWIFVVFILPFFFLSFTFWGVSNFIINHFVISFDNFFPLILLIIVVISLLIDHYREHKRLVDILNQAMEQTIK